MSTNELSDEQLITAVAQNDVAAYRVLYDRYAPSVKGLAYKMLRDEGAAEEIVQETFWRVWDGADSYNQSRGTLPNWLFGIARNLSIDTLRKGRNVKWQSLPSSEGDQDEYSHHFRSSHDVAESAWISMKYSQVHLALAELPADQRDVITWIYFQGKTRRQIAQEQDIPFGTINTRARLALDKLKRALQANGFEE